MYAYIHIFIIKILLRISIANFSITKLLYYYQRHKTTQEQTRSQSTRPMRQYQIDLYTYILHRSIQIYYIQTAAHMIYILV